MVQGRDEQLPEALPQGVTIDHPLELADRLRVPADGQLGGEVVLGGGQAQLFEAAALADDERFPVDVGEGGSDPQVKPVPEGPADRVGGRTLRARQPGPGDDPLEPEGVHRLLVEHQLVAARTRPQPVGVIDLAEDPPQARHMEAKRLDGGIGRLVAPEPVDEDVVGQQALRIQRHERQLSLGAPLDNNSREDQTGLGHRRASPPTPTSGGPNRFLCRETPVPYVLSQDTGTMLDGVRIGSVPVIVDRLPRPACAASWVRAGGRPGGRA